MRAGYPVRTFDRSTPKDRITRFKDIGLQSDILSTIATLQDFCKALDPDSYAYIYPYDAFIDDWNDENDF